MWERALVVFHNSREGSGNRLGGGLRSDCRSCGKEGSACSLPSVQLSLAAEEAFGADRLLSYREET